MNMALVRAYANLVKKGRRTIEQVPAEYREAVEKYNESQRQEP